MVESLERRGFGPIMSQLSWFTLFLAALAAVACCHPEDEPVCDEARPIIGDGACCERHRVAGMAAFRTVAELEAARRGGLDAPAPP